MELDEKNNEQIVENEEILEDEKIVEDEEIIENEEMENADENEITEKEEQANFIDFLLSNIVDTAVLLGISAVLLYVIDAIMRAAAGYYIVKKVDMLLIIVLIVSVIYRTIIDNSKNGKTIGKKILNIK